MRWIPDSTGQFPQRPYYDRDELEQECEGVVAAFLRSRYHAVTYPISTNDLTVMLEREVADLDLYAELAEGIDGATDFVRGAKPQVQIARALSEQMWRENRLRTTLTHELGHVKFHSVLLRFDPAAQLSLFGEPPRPTSWQCARETILGKGVDWKEWQAGYASGAFLMPVGALRSVVGEVVETHGVFGAVGLDTRAAGVLIRRVQLTFQVSANAACVRLQQLGHLGPATPARPLLPPQET